ncbi:uncharacterized protein LOC123675136 isoform X2 [Harmonia axyridis]|uniref:uncharacterized protein LOC123675136 isoform X2 n=1 Tax=Harmonia axyridis TaxID=115357 RepID=UPI001E276207|nr:uncharacterized protein LOC123675136 isoform X2 [Harmonia axyridis]
MCIMNPHFESSSPTLGGGVSSAPPTYDEAVGNIPPGPKDNYIPNADKAEEEKERKALPAPVTSQPQPQLQTYNFEQPVSTPSSSNDCAVCCLWCDGEDIADICYCIICCCRHNTNHDVGCCNCNICGDSPEGCCECGDCDCGDCDCGACDCGNCDCGNCDCGDCTIL